MEQYEKEPYNDKLKVGMRVALVSPYLNKLISYATVFGIDFRSATIKKDDNVKGGGIYIPEYGSGWYICQREGDDIWYDGEYIIHKVIEQVNNWKNKIGDLNVN
jgi:hypothetical protein